MGSVKVLLMLIFLASITSSHSTPFVVIHGVGIDCRTHLVRNMLGFLIDWSGSPGYCLEIGNGRLDSWIKPLMQQTAIACEKVKEMSDLAQGYNIVGLSQGNMIARGIIETCDGAPPVKNLISLAGPHAGIASVPFCGPGPVCTLVNQILKLGVYSSRVQNTVAPSGYVKVPDNIEGYLRGCSFLPYINNEIMNQGSSTHRERFASLENLILIMFDQDRVVIPKETSWFGFYSDGAFSPIIPVQQTKLYTEDWIGLKALDEAGKVKFVNVTGEHLLISESDMKTYVVPYLKEHTNKDHLE